MHLSSLHQLLYPIPLLGVDGIVLISHGRSSPRAIYSAMKLGKKIVDSDFLNTMKNKMKNKEN